MVDKTFVFVDADFDLFKSCYMESGEWGNCKFEVAPDQCSREHLASLLSGENIAAVIFMDGRTKHWEALKQYYLDGGVVVFFGIIGEFQAPYHFSNRLGFTWRFCAYTRHEFELTTKAVHSLGNSVTTQQYTKCNLISVPEEDRWMVPKAPTLEEFINDNVGYSDEANADEETLEEIREARERYPTYVEELYNQCPLAVHDESNGGKFIYLGFVNGNGNIPKFVRGLLLGETISK